MERKAKQAKDWKKAWPYRLKRKLGIKSVPRDLPLWATDVGEDLPGQEGREQVYSLELSAFLGVPGRGTGLPPQLFLFLSGGE